HSAEGVASVCLDQARIAELAVTHFVARGIRNLTVFRFDDSPFAVLRERYFIEAAARVGARIAPPWFVEGAVPSRREEHPKVVMAWLAGLPKPCGVFACCDAWARIVGRYGQVSGLRIPEDVALVGVDNDAVECETMAPPLTSVAVPWRSVGESAARLLQLGLRGKPIAGTQVLIPPIDVIVRRSSDTFALADEPLVAAAVRWIRDHADKRVSVPMVARAVGATRQRLERHFRRSLGHTVLREIHRAHVEVARRLLSTTDLPLSQVAKSSGFTNVALLSVAFRREVGVPPGAYRRTARGVGTGDD
ncbi:MAG TPA: substrate-binding domain-containing protein, partial [Polyangiaceae bacterium]|nr:substrate-binding domain-containing protein [Polyangiaceae bacterium]